MSKIPINNPNAEWVSIIQQVLALGWILNWMIGGIFGDEPFFIIGTLFMIILYLVSVIYFIVMIFSKELKFESHTDFWTLAFVVFVSIIFIAAPKDEPFRVSTSAEIRRDLGYTT